jgi:hypothetical protein
MPEIPINWLAVVAAVVIRMIVGTIWYSPVAFVKPWQELSGVTPESMKAGLGKAIGVDVVMSLVMAFAMANIIGASGITDWVNGAIAGLWLWLGFVVATHLPLWAYENRPIKLAAINAGANLISMVLMGAILGGWR